MTVISFPGQHSRRHHEGKPSVIGASKGAKIRTENVRAAPARRPSAQRVVSRCVCVRACVCDIESEWCRGRYVCVRACDMTIESERCRDRCVCVRACVALRVSGVKVGVRACVCVCGIESEWCEGRCACVCACARVCGIESGGVCVCMRAYVCVHVWH